MNSPDLKQPLYATSNSYLYLRNQLYRDKGPLFDAAAARFAAFFAAEVNANENLMWQTMIGVHSNHRGVNAPQRERVLRYEDTEDQMYTVMMYQGCAAMVEMIEYLRGNNSFATVYPHYQGKTQEDLMLFVARNDPSFVFRYASLFSTSEAVNTHFPGWRDMLHAAKSLAEDESEQLDLFVNGMQARQVVHGGSLPEDVDFCTIESNLVV